MLKAFLFDDKRGEVVTDWESAARRLSDRQLLWVDLEDPVEDERRSVWAAFCLNAELGEREGERAPGVLFHDGFISVTATAAQADPDSPASAAQSLEFFIGTNWTVTTHRPGCVPVESFMQMVTGAGNVGLLDAPAFVATLLESVVATYADAFSEIERTLEDFDAKVLGSPERDVEAEVRELVAARRRVGSLRRSLAPHRAVFAALSHSELDLVTTEKSARRFAHLEQRVGDTLESGRVAKESVVNSFDMLILRTEHQTNEVVKVLTLASILLLPGALLAGLMGMNVNLTGTDFVTSPLFWGVLVTILVTAGATIAFARRRHWV